MLAYSVVETAQIPETMGGVWDEEVVVVVLLGRRTDDEMGDDVGGIE